MENSHRARWLSLELRRSSWFIVVGLFCAILVALFGLSTSAHAAQTVPYKINFQGRLTDGSGNPMADGLYNMRFRLHNVSSGGTAIWTETREAGNRVQVTNGHFSVQLGDVTTLNIQTTPNLWFEVELPTPATATCSTVACASWTEGPMSPRSKLGASMYAMNADTVDGIDGASLARIDAANTFSAANVFNAASTFNSTLTIASGNSSTKLVVRDGSNTDLLVADTASMVVKVGNPGVATLSGVRLLTTSAEFSGTIRIGNATDGIDIDASGITLRGNARKVRKVTLSPEFSGSTFTGDGSNNNGTLRSDFCSPAALLSVNAAECVNATGGSRNFNYYEWTVSDPSAQDYDIYVRYQMPMDYASGTMTSLQAWGHTSSSSIGAAYLSMYADASATPCFTTADLAYGDKQWHGEVTASPLGACNIQAGDYVTFKYSFSAYNNHTVKVGDISFDYRSRF